MEIMKFLDKEHRKKNIEYRVFVGVFFSPILAYFMLIYYKWVDQQYCNLLFSYWLMY